MRDYASAQERKVETAKVLEGQAEFGQVLAPPETVARRRYGKRLAIAALGSIDKALDDEGLIEVRVLHDGTQGADLDRFIKVLDGGASP